MNEQAPTQPNRVKHTAQLFGLIGLGVAIGLFIWQGITPVLKIFAAAGFGIVWVSLYHFVPMLANAKAWQVLLPHYKRPNLLLFTWAVWLREAVNGLLPVARIGGEVVTARLLMQSGIGAAPAVACVVADVTLSLGSQLAFTLLGLALLFLHNGASSLLEQTLVGALVALPIIGALAFAQKLGLFSLLQRAVNLLFGDRFTAMLGNAQRLDTTLRRIYRRNHALFACGFWQLIGWVLGAGEIWLALWFLGHKVDFDVALIIEALIQALSSGAFVVPGALGVQEGGFMLIGGMMGIASDTALALALTRRARDILVFVPALLGWQVQLGNKLMSKKN